MELSAKFSKFFVRFRRDWLLPKRFGCVNEWLRWCFRQSYSQEWNKWGGTHFPNCILPGVSRETNDQSNHRKLCPKMDIAFDQWISCDIGWSNTGPNIYTRKQFDNPCTVSDRLLMQSVFGGLKMMRWSCRSKIEVCIRYWIYWSRVSHLPVTSFPGFIGWIFPESKEDWKLSFGCFSSTGELKYLGIFEGRELVASFRPDKSLSPSGLVARRVRLSMLSANDAQNQITDKEGPDSEAGTSGVAEAPKDNYKASNSPGHFQDLYLPLPLGGRKK